MAAETVVITPDIDDLAETAKKLLAAAGHPSEVATDTSGRSTGFRVSAELAKKAGYEVEDSADESDGDSDGDSGADDAEPPRTGAGSGKGAWQEFLYGQGVAFADTDDRDDLFAIWDAHKAEQG